MASGSRRGSVPMQLALCASFLWFLYSLERQSLIGNPRLSAFLIFLVAGVVTYFGADVFSKWLPGATGRFDDEATTTPRGSSSLSSLPKRPRRFFIPALIACVVIRLEAFIGVKHNFQCSKAGIEAFLPLVILSYELLPGRRSRAEGYSELPLDDLSPPTPSSPGKGNGSGSVDSRALGLISGVNTFTLCLGVSFSMKHRVRSTTFCSTLDPSFWVVLLQLLGLALDASIAVLLWRIVAWTRTTPLRVKTISTLLLQASAGIGLMLASDLLLGGMRPSSPATDGYFLGVDSLYVFDILSHGIFFAVLVVSSSIYMCEYGPATLANVLAFLCGLLAVAHRLPLVGTWELPKSSVFPCVSAITLGFASVLLHDSNLQAVSIFVRAPLVFALLLVLIVTAIYTALVGPTYDRHPVQGLIYDARIETDRWLVHASVSKTVKVAVQEYKERHNGRAPPRGFDAWYKFAQSRKSAVMDHFGQIDSDILPFWGVKPAVIREGIARLEREQGIAILVVRDGSVSFKKAYFSDPQRRESLDTIADTVRAFAKDLPNLEMAINLDDRPRVLAPWQDLHRHTHAAEKSGWRLLPRDAAGTENTAKAAAATPVTATDTVDSAKTATPDDGAAQAMIRITPTVGEFREMNAKTCPSGSRTRSTWHWNTRDLCSPCARASGKSWARQGPFVNDWSHSSDLCHQPDIFNLHGFYLAPPFLLPFSELLPVFSRAKAGGFNDILFPWPRRRSEGSEGSNGSGFAAAVDVGVNFQMMSDKLVWRGRIEQPELGHALRHGGHIERLAHLVNNASDADEVTLFLASKPGSEERFGFERVKAREANAALPFDVRIGEYAYCGGGGGDGDGSDDGSTGSGTTAAAATAAGAQCNAMAQAEFGPLAPAASVPPGTGAGAGSRYILVTDADSGSPRGGDEVLRALESKSAPFVMTIFREWFTERLTPWAHFVPVDVRLQALHGSLAYFTGLKGRGRVGGRDPDMDARLDDAEWIAEQGRRWAARALRREDAEVYLFRLLLEWGRVMSDQREEMSFRGGDG